MRKPGPRAGFFFLRDLSGTFISCPPRIHTSICNSRCAMTPETEGKEEKGPSGVPFVNDPGNEDPGSLMDDAQVPLIDDEDAELEEESYD